MSPIFPQPATSPSPPSLSDATTPSTASSQLCSPTTARAPSALAGASTRVSKVLISPTICPANASIIPISRPLRHITTLSLITSTPFAFYAFLWLPKPAGSHYTPAQSTKNNRIRPSGWGANINIRWSPLATRLHHSPPPPFDSALRARERT
ncbi:hypothetical protein FRC12_020589, partial [Ceratobasidium sp. 428]